MKLNLEPLSQEASVFLNIIRLVACELVVIDHFITHYQPENLTSFFIGGTLGGIGVFLFFCISGILVSYSLMQKTQNSVYRFRNYLVDRFSRIYSGLVPAVIVAAICALGIFITNRVYFDFLNSSETTPMALNFGLTLVMAKPFPFGLFNWVSSAFGATVSLSSIMPLGFDAILWTLVVEWWIYMFFGWSIFGVLNLSRNRRISIRYKTLFWAVAALLSLILASLMWDYSAFVLVWFVGAAMMIGATNGRIRSKLSSPRATKILIAVLALLLVSDGYETYIVLFRTHETLNPIYGLLISTSVFLSVLLLNGKNLQGISRWILQKRVVDYSTVMAGFSYTIFLIHYPVILFLNGLNASTNKYLMFIPVILLLNVIAFCIALFTERKHRELAAKIKSWLHISNC